MTYEEAWEQQETWEGKPSAWVQWKGTAVCMDVHCECGVATHFDGEHSYNVKCGQCGKVYFVNGHVQLIKLTEEPTHMTVVKSYV